MLVGQNRLPRRHANTERLEHIDLLPPERSVGVRDGSLHDRQHAVRAGDAAQKLLSADIPEQEHRGGADAAAVSELRNLHCQAGLRSGMMPNALLT